MTRKSRDTVRVLEKKKCLRFKISDCKKPFGRNNFRNFSSKLKRSEIFALYCKCISFLTKGIGSKSHISFIRENIYLLYDIFSVFHACNMNQRLVILLLLLQRIKILFTFIIDTLDIEPCHIFG